MKYWLVLLLIIAAAAIAYISYRRTPAPPRPLEPEPLAVGLHIPDFTLTDQDGHAADQSLFEGRVTILDFIFTNCQLACPMMRASMEQIAGDLEKTPVRFVSISVDPAHDTPEVLKVYASQGILAPPRWTLLTGDRATVERVIRDALQQELQPDPERKFKLADGSTMDNINHPTRLLLVGPDRRVLGYYKHDDPEEVARLKTRARLAADRIPR